jgi:hypothetical protein
MKMHACDETNKHDTFIIKAVTQDELKAPTFTVCPPPDIQSLYIADRKEKTVKVTWTDPTATDDKEILSYVKSGFNMNNVFHNTP